MFWVRDDRPTRNPIFRPPGALDARLGALSGWIWVKFMRPAILDPHNLGGRAVRGVYCEHYIYRGLGGGVNQALEENMRLLGGWHCYFILSPRKIQRENLLALKFGKAHLRKNPVRRPKDESGPATNDPRNAAHGKADQEPGVCAECSGVGSPEGDK